MHVKHGQIIRIFFFKKRLRLSSSPVQLFSDEPERQMIIRRFVTKHIQQRTAHHLSLLSLSLILSVSLCFFSASHWVFFSIPTKARKRIGFVFILFCFFPSFFKKKKEKKKGRPGKWKEEQNGGSTFVAAVALVAVVAVVAVVVVGVSGWPSFVRPLN